jgi:hypothetical protein
MGRKQKPYQTSWGEIIPGLFRTKKDRTLELTSAAKEIDPSKGSGRRKIAVKVVDIFGNDTMTIVDVSAGDGKKKGK